MKNKSPDNFRAKDELRSEKVRNIIGQIPPILLRYGISIIGIALLMVVAVAAFIPYQPNYSVELIVEQNSKGELAYIAHIPEKIMTKKSEFDHISINNASEFPVPKQFLVISISSTTFITQNGVWHNAKLIPKDDEGQDIMLENSITIPAKINLKRISVLKWIMNYRTMSS